MRLPKHAGAAGVAAISPAAVASWLLYLAPLVVLGVYFWGWLDHAWSVVRFPYQIDYGEMPELNRAWLLSQAKPIYVDWSHPPYQMANYTPLYSMAAALGVRLFGVQFFSGRLISFVACLITGLCIASIVRALGGSWLAATISFALYFVAYPVWQWGPYERVDAFSVAFELLGVAMFCWGWIRRRSTRALWLTVVLFLIAAYARQTVAAGAFACYGYLLFRRPKLAIAAIATYAACGLALFALLQLVTAGQFSRHIVTGNTNAWSWDTVKFYWDPFWRVLHWSLPLAAVGLLLMLVRRKAQVPLLYLIASAATALTIGKVGSSVNYLLQLWAALSLAGGLTAAYVEQLGIWAARGRWYGAVLGMVPALWLLVGLQQAYHAVWAPVRVRVAGQAPLTSPNAHVMEALRLGRLPLWRLDPWHSPPRQLTSYFRDRYPENPDQQDADNSRRAQSYVAALTGDILAEDMAFTITTGKQIYVQPFEFNQLAADGRFDLRPLLKDVQQKRFSAVILRFRLGDDPSWHIQRLNRDMINAIAAAYRFDANFGSYYMYRPR